MPSGGAAAALPAGALLPTDKAGALRSAGRRARKEFTNDEDAALLAGVATYGDSAWGAIRKSSPLLNCRRRDVLKRRARALSAMADARAAGRRPWRRFSAEDDAAIRAAVAAHGWGNWTVVAREPALKGRAVAGIAKRARQLRLLPELGADPPHPRR